YKTLGVEQSASADEIKRGYSRLAPKYHPAVHKDKGADEQFKKIQEAWEVLSDPQKKSQYDQFGSTGGGMPGGGGFGGFNTEDFSGFAGGGLGDIFESFFGGAGGQAQQHGSARGRNIHGNARISFSESVSGKKYTVSVETYVPCKICEGSGRKKGTGTKECVTCNGVGQVSRQQHTPLGIIRTASVCPDCRGEGRKAEHPCSDCAGTGRILEKKDITIDIPAGIFEGALLRIPGKGEAGERGQMPGDFLLRVSVAPDKRFRREDNDIHT
ncbi:MAG: DnaJ domain-containing protein, partial [bacterium]|nr:DnaJ domain-containing protein [bacterium]